MFLTELWGQAGGAEPIGRPMRQRVIAVSALLALGAVAGCASDGGVDTESPVAGSAPTTSTVEASASPSTSANDDAVLAAYREFFARQTEISKAPADQRRDLLEPFTTNPALDRVLSGMFAAQELGEVGYGAAVVDPSVQKIRGDQATVTDCQDTRDSGRKERATGDVVTRGTEEAKVEATLRRGSDGSWRMSTIDYLGDEC